MSLILFFLLGTVHTIGNQWISVGVTDATASNRAGSIVSLSDSWSGAQLVPDGQFSGVHTGSFLPANGVVTLLSDTSLVFHSTHFTGGGNTLPLDLTIVYTVVERGLEISYRFDYLENIQFTDPLEVDFVVTNWDSLHTGNQTTTDESFPINGGTGYQRFSGDQLFTLTGGQPEALFIFPNIAKGIIAVTDLPNSSYISIRVLDTEPPRENAVGPDLHSVIPAGQVDEYFVRFSMDEYFNPLFISGHPHGARRSAGWIMDEIPMIHPGQGNIWGFSESSQGTEVVSAALIGYLEDHPQLKMNWIILPDGILDPNRDSVWFEPGYEDSWSHWHCTWRISTEATPDYLQWLRNIQDNVYPWSNRVTMGSHGYHHTPNADSSFGGFHEFITYEPEEHQERFRIVSLDIDDCGLDTSMVRVIRFPGHRTSLSGLKAIIDHGFTFYCNGWRLIDSYAGKQFRNQWITRYQTENGRIWGSNTVWWADYNGSHPFYYLSEVMEKGKFGLLGCHPINMLDAGTGTVNPVAQARIDSVLTSLETDYEDFIWMLPEEYGDFLENCFSIRVDGIDGHPPDLTLSFTGPVPEGLTFCAGLQPGDSVLGVTLDGTSIPWEMGPDGMLFAISGERPGGDHTLVVTIDPLGIEGNGSGRPVFSAVVPSPVHGTVLNVSTPGLAAGSSALLSVFDLAGRTVYRENVIIQPDCLRIVPGDSPAPGVYFVTVTSMGHTARTRTILLR